MAVVNPQDKIPSLDERGKTEYVPNALRGYMSASKNRHLFARQVKQIYYPSPGGYNDPLSAMCVVDLVMRLRPSDVIRAKYLYKLLQHTHPQVIWNAVLVGQHLNEIHNICLESFTDPTQSPISATRDFEGLKFRLNPTNEGWKWLEKMRVFAGERAAATAKALRDGDEISRSVSVWVGLEPRLNQMGDDRVESVVEVAK